MKHFRAKTDRFLSTGGQYVEPEANLGYIPSMIQNDLITIDPEILGGTPVFKGTRVPVKTLFDYLEDNYTLEEFLDQL